VPVSICYELAGSVALLLALRDRLEPGQPTPESPELLFRGPRGEIRADLGQLPVAGVPGRPPSLALTVEPKGEKPRLIVIDVRNCSGNAALQCVAEVEKWGSWKQVDAARGFLATPEALAATDFVSPVALDLASDPVAAWQSVVDDVVRPIM